MPLGVSEAERRAPRPAEHEPLLDAEMRPDALGVLHEVSRRVLAQLAERRRLPRAALIEQDDPPERGIEEPAVKGRDARAGTSVKENDRWSRRIPGFLDVQFVNPGDAQTEGAERLDLGKKRHHVEIMSEDRGALPKPPRAAATRSAGATG
jgi:hypothetical protein